MRNAVVRRSDVLRAQLEVLLLVEVHATPGPWDSRRGWVVAPTVPMIDARYAIESYEYYGGELVCESVKSADSVLVAASRNLLPDLARAHLDALDEIENLRRQLRSALFLTLDRVEAADFSEIVEACGYRVTFVPKVA